MIKNCKKCNKTFVGRKEKIYCSRDCYALSIPEILGKKEERFCLNCGSSFSVVPSSLVKYCSRSCSSLHKWSDSEYRIHMSEVHKGIPKKGGYVFKKGENHPNWKGGTAAKDKRHREKTETKIKRCFYQLQRYYRSKTATGRFTIEDWKRIKEKYNFTCLSCGKREPEIKLTIDHIQPLSKNGSNNIDNIQPLCRSCNARKNARMIDYRLTFNFGK